VLTPFEIYQEYLIKWFTNESFIGQLDRDTRLTLIQIIILTQKITVIGDPERFIKNINELFRISR
jgi:hypothetical protein